VAAAPSTLLSAAIFVAKPASSERVIATPRLP
jgi:hypothetical protein